MTTTSDNRFVVCIGGHMMSSELADSGLQDLRKIVDEIGPEFASDLAPKKDSMRAQVEGAFQVLAQIAAAVLRDNRRAEIESLRFKLAKLIAEWGLE